MANPNPLSRFAGIALLLVSEALIAQQPATVGELLDKGGRKLAKEEITTLLSGAIVHGTQAGTGAQFNNTHSADGSVNGNARLANGRTVGVFGKWYVNDQGQYCRDFSTTAGDKIGGCSFYFALDNAYYETKGDDKTATLLVREIEKR